MQHIIKPAFDGVLFNPRVSYWISLPPKYLINEMQSMCTKVADTKWISMYFTTKWLAQDCFHVTEYLKDKPHNVHPIHFGELSSCNLGICF